MGFWVNRVVERPGWAQIKLTIVLSGAGAIFSVPGMMAHHQVSEVLGRVKGHARHNTDGGVVYAVLDRDRDVPVDGISGQHPNQTTIRSYYMVHKAVLAAVMLNLPD